MDHVTTEAQHGGVERRRGAGGCFVKHVGKDGPLEQVCLALLADNFRHFRSGCDDRFNVLPGELTDGDHGATFPPGLLLLRLSQRWCTPATTTNNNAAR